VQELILHVVKIYKNLKPQAEKSEIHNLMSELQKFIKLQEKPNEQAKNE
jgi:hypothetical protein